MQVRSCADFYVDDLRHSYPYLVPEAAALLHDIGAAFNDSLEARGGGSYRMKVTSLLRTPYTVRSLRRVNRNAVGESTHFYGTTLGSDTLMSGASERMPRLTILRESTCNVKNGKVAFKPSSTREAFTSASRTLLATFRANGVRRSGLSMLTAHISVPATSSTAAIAVQRTILTIRRHNG